MQNIIKYFQQILADDNGVASSKRMVTFLFTFLIAIAFIGNFIWDLTVEKHLLDAAMIIVISGFGFTGVEKFAPRITKEKNDGK